MILSCSCLAAAYERQLEILAVTTVAGNHLIDKVTKNALDVLDFLKMDVPVARGMDTHILNPVRPAEDAHGENALGNVTLPDSVRKPVDDSMRGVVYSRPFDGIGRR